MKIVIVIDEKGEVWFYTTSEVDDNVVLVNPRIKKKEWETEEEDKLTH